MQIDLPIKAYQPDIHNLYKMRLYLYMPFPLPFIDLPRNPYKYQLHLPTIFTNRTDIYILALIGLCLLMYSIAMSKILCNFAIRNSNANLKNDQINNTKTYGESRQIF